MIASYLLWVDACYACSNGTWSSYTSAAWVDADDAPELFTSIASAIPAPVAKALDGADGVTWGHASPAWRELFAAQ